MKRAAIIGLGTITQHYLRGIEASDTISLCAVCDTDPAAVSRACFEDYPFYTDYRVMLSEVTPDWVILSTPPESHYAIAHYALSHGVGVIVEKPAVLDMAEYDALLALARSNGVLFEVMFHWQNGSEVQAFNQTFAAKHITAVEVTVLDPYSADGVTIDPAKRKLMGTWIDSGVNALSMIKAWLPFQTLEVLDTQQQRCPQSDLPIYTRVQMRIDDVPVCITVDWRQHTNKKESFVVWNGRTLHINHSAQQIQEGDTVLADCYHMERLPQHYYHYFKNFSGEADTEAARRIHHILLEVNKTL